MSRTGQDLIPRIATEYPEVAPAATLERMLSELGSIRAVARSLGSERATVRRAMAALGISWGSASGGHAIARAHTKAKAAGVRPHLCALGFVGRLAIDRPALTPRRILKLELAAAGGEVPEMARRLRSTRPQVEAALDAFGIPWRKG